MKKVVIALVVLSLLTIATMQVMHFIRFRVSDRYDLKVSKEIDAQYHNLDALQQYYDLSYKAGDYARQVWFNEGIDVMIVDEQNPQSITANKVYRGMVSKAKFLEGRLIQSSIYKKQGYSNEEIKVFEASGNSPLKIIAMKSAKAFPYKKGDKGPGVWYIQLGLKKAGKVIIPDGDFIEITQEAVKEFQGANNIFPNGVVDEITYNELVKKL